jgi:hypothetical protein
MARVAKIFRSIDRVRSESDRDTLTGCHPFVTRGAFSGARWAGSGRSAPLATVSFTPSSGFATQATATWRVVGP